MSSGGGDGHQVLSGHCAPLPSVSQSLDAGAWHGDSGCDMCFHPKECQSNAEARQDVPIRTTEDPTSC